jgi:hypothetical protein
VDTGTPQQQQNPFATGTSSRLSLKRKKKNQDQHFSQPPEHYTPIEITPIDPSPLTEDTGTVKRRLFAGPTPTTVGMFYL